MEKLSEVPRERIYTWIANIIAIRREYENGVHSPLRCKHCDEAKMFIRTYKIKSSICTVCVWSYFESSDGINCSLETLCVARVFPNVFKSTDQKHDKQTHIDRCNFWLQALNHEILRRNKFLYGT